MYFPLPMAHLDLAKISKTHKIKHRYLIARLALALRTVLRENVSPNWCEGIKSCLEHLMYSYGFAAVLGIPIPSSIVVQELFTSFYPHRLPDDQLRAALGRVLHGLSAISDIDADEALCEQATSTAWWTWSSEGRMPSYEAVSHEFDESFAQYIRSDWHPQNHRLDAVVFGPQSADAGIPLLREWIHRTGNIPTESELSSHYNSMSKALQDFATLKQEYLSLQTMVRSIKSRYEEAVTRSQFAVQAYGALANSCEKHGILPFPKPQLLFQNNLTEHPQFGPTSHF
ncbi:hypothetical protein CPB83DRAFT_900538 [Crepidotus variabilis]|uniref:Uncharacterized protein n=1 Tax=Crepidotus variabilis TaxID=179855 RepID=A0A9P6E315_9AGAR|nr:hypothetical protein CPB83DRAFT_900538 [Crepidotus variabilis]